MALWKHFRGTIYSRCEDFLLFEVLENSAEDSCACLVLLSRAPCFASVGGDARGDLGSALPCVLRWGSCQEAAEGGGGGPLGSAPREYVGFLIAASGDGSSLPPSAALNAQLLPYIFFLPLPTSAADSFGEGATRTSALGKGSGSVC